MGSIALKRQPDQMLPKRPEFNMLTQTPEKKMLPVITKDGQEHLMSKYGITEDEIRELCIRIEAITELKISEKVKISTINRINLHHEKSFDLFDFRKDLFLRDFNYLKSKGELPIGEEKALFAAHFGLTFGADEEIVVHYKGFDMICIVEQNFNKFVEKSFKDTGIRALLPNTDNEAKKAEVDKKAKEILRKVVALHVIANAFTEKTIYDNGPKLYEEKVGLEATQFALSFRRDAGEKGLEDRYNQVGKKLADVFIFVKALSSLVGGRALQDFDALVLNEGGMNVNLVPDETSGLVDRYKDFLANAGMLAKRNLIPWMVKDTGNIPILNEVIGRADFAGVPVRVKNGNWEGSVIEGDGVKRGVLIGLKNGEVHLSYSEIDKPDHNLLQVSMHAKPSKNLKMEDIELKSFNTYHSQMKEDVPKGRLIGFLNKPEVQGWLNGEGNVEAYLKRVKIDIPKSGPSPLVQ